MFEASFAAEHIVIPFAVTVFGGVAAELLCDLIKKSGCSFKKSRMLG